VETVSYESEAARRIAEMLDSAMGEAIKGWLQDPAIAEVMLNPDGRLWIDRLAGGLSDTGKRLSAEDGGRIVRVIAHHVGAEVTSSSPRLSAELPGSGERFEGLIPPIVEAPAFAIRKPAIAVFTLTQGSKLTGAYDSQVSYGQNRLLLVWTRLIIPNGRSVVLERQPGADPQGFTGLEDEADQHWDRLFMGAILSTAIGIGTELGSNANDSSIASALRQGSSNSLSQTGQQVTQRNLNIQPTLTIRPGFPVRVIINRDLVLAVYQG
jgi:hypothetical protein